MSKIQTMRNILNQLNEEQYFDDPDFIDKAEETIDKLSKLQKDLQSVVMNINDALDGSSIQNNALAYWLGQLNDISNLGEGNPYNSSINSAIDDLNNDIKEFNEIHAKDGNDQE